MKKNKKMLGVPMLDNDIGETQIYRHPASFRDLETSPDKDVFTMYDVITKLYKQYGDNNFLGTFSAEENCYKYITWE